MDEVNKAVSGIYSWIGNRAPKQDLPKCVRKRIDWVLRLVDYSGLDFMGAMRAVLAQDDDFEIKDELSFDWLPVTPEFRKWRDSYAYRTGEMQVAVELIYGTQEATDNDHD